MDLQSSQRFILLEQQLGELAQTVLVEAAAATKTNKKKTSDLFKKKNLSTTRLLFKRRVSDWTGLKFSQSLQLLQLVEGSSLHDGDLVLHQVAEKNREKRNKSLLQTMVQTFQTLSHCMLFGIVMTLTFVLLAPPTRLTSRRDTVMMSEEVKSPFFFVLHYCPRLIWCCFVVFCLFVCCVWSKINE